MSTGPRRDDLAEPLRSQEPAAATDDERESGLAPAAPSTGVDAEQERKTRLELADRLTTLGAMTAAIGHELNNPLTYVVGNLHHVAEVLAARKPDSPVDPELEQCVREALAGAERVARIVQDMRTLERRDALQIAPVELQEVLEVAIRQTSNHTRHRARLTRHYAPVGTVDAESPRLTQVFVNLLLNAAQAIPQGQAKRNEISVSLYEEGGLVVVQITDTGRGIPADVLPRIFEPFYTTKPIGEGSGLGLAISRAIVKSFGGEIEAISNVTVGTTVQVRLPRGKLARRSEPDLASSVPPAALPPAAAAKPRILVVDDDALILGTVRRVLGRNYDITCVADSRDVLSSLANNEPFDLILCDLIMPDMTGMEVHAEVSKRSAELAKRMLFMTGGAFTAEARAFLEQGHVRYVDKPFSPQALAAAVQKTLAKFAGRGPTWPSRPPSPVAPLAAEFALRFPKRWDQLEMVRESCGYFARAACNDVASGQRVSLIVHELVENAIKYATSEEDRVEVDLRGTHESFEVAVSNRSSREHSSHLFTVISELEASDPQAAYLSAMRRSSRTALRAGGLGLARIVFEAQAQLSADFADGRMRVVARGLR